MVKKRRKRKEVQDGQIIGIVIRYALALLLSLNSLFIFYFVLRPLTFYPVAFLLKLIYSAQIIGMEKIIIGIHEITFVNACIAGSAYYLLAVLNLTTPGIKWLDRIKIFFVNSFLLLKLNFIRIIVLAVLLVNSFKIFGVMHFVFWHLISVVLVAGIWISSVRYREIKGIPVYSDIVYLKGLIRKR